MRAALYADICVAKVANLHALPLQAKARRSSVVVVVMVA